MRRQLEELETNLRNLGYDKEKMRHENDKIKVTKKGKIKTTKIGYFFDCKKIV